MKDEAELGLTNFLKQQLTTILEIQRNHRNDRDCLLQCLGIAKYVQKGVIPIAPVPDHSYDSETKYHINFNPITQLITGKPYNFSQFKSLMEPSRPVIYNSVSYKKLEKTLKNEATKERTGFIHGIISLFRNSLYDTGHAIYFFATKKEVLYVDNQWRAGEKETTYPFYSVLPQFIQFDRVHSDCFNENVTFTALGNWFYSLNEKSEIYGALPVSLDWNFDTELLDLETSSIFGEEKGEGEEFEFACKLTNSIFSFESLISDQGKVSVISKSIIREEKPYALKLFQNPPNNKKRKLDIFATPSFD